jgi:hypothetical protein
LGKGLTATVAVILSMSLAACDGGADEAGRPEPAVPPPSPVESPATVADATREPDAIQPTTAPPTEDCVNGWATPPERDHELIREALRVIRRHMQVEGGFSLQDFRFFEGPESPPSTKGYLDVVRRFYVKGHLQQDPSFRGRWLVERREFGSGVVAVAPYDTEGFSSPDWTGFLYQEGMEPRAFEGLPGEWVGEPYDFVTSDPFEFSGLPDEVVGCMDGT